MTAPTSVASLLHSSYQLSLDNDRVVFSAKDSTLQWTERSKRHRVYRLHCIPISRVAEISYYNILYASFDPAHRTFTIDYMIANRSKRDLDIVKSTYSLGDKAEPKYVAEFAEEILRRSYQGVERSRRMKILINPFGGKGRANSLWTNLINPVFEASRCQLDVLTTTHSGHAQAIAQEMDIDSVDVVACCSGDGLPHEVFNGLGSRSDAVEALTKVAVVQLPCGSGNAMSLNLNGTDKPAAAALAVVKGYRTPLDLMSVTQGNERYLSFLSQSFGIVAEADLGTEFMRFLGSTRFMLGVGYHIVAKTKWPADIALKIAADGKAAVRQQYAECLDREEGIHDAALLRKSQGWDCSVSLPSLQHGTVNDDLGKDWIQIEEPTISNFYAGNMAYMSPDANFFQAALPHDGCIDLLRMDSSVSFAKAIEAISGVENGEFFDMEVLQYCKVYAYRLTPREKEGYISIDGERKPFEAFQVEVHRGLGTVLSRNPSKYQTNGLPAGPQSHLE